MKKIFGAIILVIIIAAGYWVYTASGFFTTKDPVAAYDKMSALPVADQAVFIAKTIRAWSQDPGSAIPYPKHWRKVSVTVDKETFDVITPDQANPPQYYVSTNFPKRLIKKVTVARCLNLDKKKITDWCVVGDNEQINAYFKIIEWIKENSTVDSTNIPESMKLNMGFDIPTLGQ